MMRVQPLKSSKQKRKGEASGVMITLDELHAGFLRKILQDSANGRPCFAQELFEELDKYTFPEYEERYPKWREMVVK